MLHWLLSPIDPTRAHEIGLALSWHARLMVLSWGILTPTAVLIARFYKIRPRQNWPQDLDNRLWWNAHYLGQSASFVIASVALILILISQQNTGSVLVHRVLGYMIMSLGTLQILSGLFRGTKGGATAPQSDGSLRGDHYDMTRRRLVFELVHKSVGYTTIGLIVVALLSGLWEANAPHWMWLCIGGWLSLLIVVAVFLQRRGYAYDTYQAIWGPDLEHPGNNMPKQGFGVVRPSECARFKVEEGE
ncbi:cytochrome b561 domain-containing protein [Granulosicoccus antarcticus]|uniref:Cytochrome b561 domain-containing protein n=1 Tax=Granulosicoccus antarcticus IMCC3135 TaxID=1192854 RepID=A0A2Z2P1P4_9GAMM|nr:cytochrome b561 domain-containing protein [Granulosicoccus antarcticus]ASJ73534.1 hypothetical protein IMCC3135_17260 [Granulosicoccus antarcticus IMCC3135]